MRARARGYLNVADVVLVGSLKGGQLKLMMSE